MKLHPIWALIYKDSMLMRKSLIILLLFAVLLSMMHDNRFGLVYVVVFAAMQPYTAALYDEQSHWDRLARALPYTPRQLVFSKYLFGYLCLLLASVLSVATAFVMTCFEKDRVDWRSTGWALATGVFLAGLLMAIEMPMLLRFGVERGRRLFIALFALFGAAIGAAFGIMKINPFFFQKLLSSVPVSAVVVAGVFVTVFLQVYSVSLSTRLYQRRSIS